MGPPLAGGAGGGFGWLGPPLEWAGADVEFGVPVVAGVTLECAYHKARATATTATATAAQTARIRRRGRDGLMACCCRLVVCWFVVSVGVLNVDISVSYVGRTMRMDPLSAGTMPMSLERLPSSPP